MKTGISETKKTSMTKNKPVVLITAAGSSTRMGSNIKKEYMTLESGTVLSTVVKNFLSGTSIELVCITCPKGGKEDAEKAVFSDSQVCKHLKKNPDIKILFTEGGSTRQASVFNGLKKIRETLKNTENILVAIHDGARPFITKELLNRTFEKAEKCGAAFPGLEPTETQKQINSNGIVTSHLKRKDLISVQTPQIFDFNRIFNAHEKAETDGQEYTDDTEIFGRYAGPVSTVKGDAANIKITYPGDLKTNEESKKMIHTGLGYDMHRLITGRKLFLGGIEIPFEKGEDGHSDGDVLLHAITDALLGASGLGDIGSFFPPEEEKWKDADSKILLKTVWNKITENGWKLENLDCVIKIEKPKFIPYRQEVIKSISTVLNVPEDSVFVKAKTYEKTGNWENQVEAFATCLLSK